MSLLSFYKNYFTVQTNQYSGQDTDGAVDRDSGYITVATYTNVPCSIQGINAFDIANVIGKVDEQITNVIYHSKKNLALSSSNRFLVHNDPFQQITDFEDSTIRIFTFLGQRNAVFHKDTGKPFEIFVEENRRETL